MPLNVSYMGTKRKIAHRVARIISCAPQGPLLDLFSGMCAVSTAIGQARNVCCNDIQAFASNVAKAFFISAPLTMDCQNAASMTLPAFRRNSAALRNRFHAEVKEELGALASGAAPRIRALEQSMPNAATDGALGEERVALAGSPDDRPYRLFTITYSGAYFGLVQCIEIDSIRFAIDQLLADGLASRSDHRWLCLALCKTASKVATTTGHFAQHMRINERNAARFIAQRRRSVWREWLRAVFDIYPIGTSTWRAGNRVFRQDAVSLLANLDSEKSRPAVVYADPPYTRDQYSRYYHIYETLLKYDYPQSHGSGRYRPDRFRSPFSMKTQVAQAMEQLISRCASIEATLILSYPERGLLRSSADVITSFVRQHYGRDPRIHSVAVSHSSLGGSKGRQTYSVQERIYVAN